MAHSVLTDDGTWHSRGMGGKGWGESMGVKRHWRWREIRHGGYRDYKVEQTH